MVLLADVICACYRADVNVAARITPDAMRPAIYRARHQVYPQVPASLYNLGVLLTRPEYQGLTRTVDGNDNFFEGHVRSPNGQSSLVFVSQRMKRFMRHVRVVFCDGTFSSRPNTPPSAQVLQISTVVRNHVCLPVCRSFIDHPLNICSN